MKGIEKQLEGIIKKAIEVAEKTGEFAMEQAPLLLQEFYNWHIAKHSLLIVCSVLISVLIYKVACKISKETNDVFGFYIVQVFQTFPLVFGCKAIYDLLFILVAPKLYLIEYFIK